MSAVAADDAVQLERRMLPLLAALRWLHGDIMVLVLRPGPPARNAADSGDGALAG